MSIQIFVCGGKRAGSCHYCSRRAINKCDYVVVGTDGDGREAKGPCERALCGQCGKTAAGFTYCRFHTLSKKVVDSGVTV